MSDPNLHLKMDRMLAEQAKMRARLDDQHETMEIFIAAIRECRKALDTQTETIDVLSQAISQPSGSGELEEALKSIAVSLKQMKEDGSKVPVMLGRLSKDIAQATHEAVVMGLGGGVDVSGEAA